MGIAASPDGRLAYVGVQRPSGTGRLDDVNVERDVVVGTAPVGVCSFDVLAAYQWVSLSPITPPTIIARNTTFSTEVGSSPVAIANAAVSTAPIPTHTA